MIPRVAWQWARGECSIDSRGPPSISIPLTPNSFSQLHLSSDIPHSGLFVHCLSQNVNFLTGRTWSNVHCCAPRTCSNAWNVVVAQLFWYNHEFATYLGVPGSRLEIVVTFNPVAMLKKLRLGEPHSGNWQHWVYLSLNCFPQHRSSSPFFRLRNWTTNFKMFTFY